jgi:SAM-dependent methyltransferase
VAQYDVFAAFYDAVNGEPTERTAQILAYIGAFAPDAHDVLELGCGTGPILAGLGSGFALTGLDASTTMLAHARRRCPSARLLTGDITSFSLGARFDVVVCVYDTLNHVTTFDGWRAVFAHAAAHLREGGLFIFDVNTLGRLRYLGDVAPWVHDFDAHTLVMDVDFTDEPLARWRIRIFAHQHDDTYRLHHETILELGVALDEVRAALADDFALVHESDTNGATPTDESARALFVARRVGA